MLFHIVEGTSNPLTVTQEIAGSSPVAPENVFTVLCGSPGAPALGTNLELSIQWAGVSERRTKRRVSRLFQAAFCFFTFAHLARWAAAIFFRDAADIFRRGRETEFPVPKCLRALSAASKRSTTRCALARSLFSWWNIADRRTIGFLPAKDHSRDA